MEAKLFRLNGRDLLKGAVVAVLVAVLGFVKTLLDQKGLDISVEDLKNVADLSASALVGYLLKQLLSDEQDKVVGKF